MALFRKKSDIPEEQALLAAMDDMRKRPKAEPGIEDVRDIGDHDEHGVATDDETADGKTADDVGPGRGDSAGPLLDFGSLKIPGVQGMQLRVEIDEQENPVAVSVMLDDTVLQLQAFAAPRSEQLWDEVRQEIAEGIRGGQGKARETDGPFGRELQAEVVLTDADGKSLRQPARFIGVDGERWFLRGVVTGAGATEPERAGPVEQIFAGVEVDRGEHAAAPRDPLQITMPDDPALSSEPVEPAGSEDSPDGGPVLT
ncbi:MAG: DUF3710 domain-containing protein [Actinomycetes bacterium]